MRIKKFGIELISLEIQDIELVRSWRNSDSVKKHMIFREHISADMQRNWFESLNKNEIYLLIISNSEKIGLISIKNIDKSKRSGEAGIFIGSEAFRNTVTPIFAIMALMDIVFEKLKFNSLFAKVLKSNTVALEMNLELGYEIISSKENYYKLLLLKEQYRKSTLELKRKIKKLSPTDEFFELNKDEKLPFL